MDIHVKNTYDLFFHPFKGEGPTKKGFGRLAASVAIFIGTVGLYHLVVGSIQKWRVTHPGEEAKVGQVFHSVHGSKEENTTQESQDSSQELTEPKTDRNGNVLDFTLVGSDGVKVRANLEFLSQKTGFFGGRQRSGLSDASQMRIDSEFSGKTLKLMMDFLSNGSVSLNHSEEQLGELIAAADFYDIPDLKLKIESGVFYANHPQVIRPSLWKEWAAAAGLDIHTITDEEAFEALPKNIEEILKAPCRIFGRRKSGRKKTVEETRMHVYIPPGLTAEDLGKILKTRFPGTEAGYRYSWAPILAALKDQPTVGGWVEMTKDVIPGSRIQTYAKQQEMVQALYKDSERYEVPTALEAIACCLAWNFKTQERLFSNAPWTHTRCQEQVKGFQVVVGGFAPAGLDVYYDFFCDDDHIGVAALRRFF